MSSHNDLIVLQRVSMRYYKWYSKGFLSQVQYIILIRPIDREIDKIQMSIFVGKWTKIVEKETLTKDTAKSAIKSA